MMSKSMFTAESYEEVAANGLQVAIRRMCDKHNLSPKEVQERLAEYIECNFLQLGRYISYEGLPKHFVDKAVRFFHINQVLVGKHQLAPTKAILSTYGINDD